MQCLEVSELISLALDASVTQEQNQVLHEHLAVCEQCRTEWQHMQRVTALFSRVEFAVPPPMFSRQVMARIRRRAIWLAVLKGSGIVALSVVIVAALCVMPVMGVSSVAATFLGNPSVIRAFIGAIVRAMDIVITLARAMGLILEALLGSPNWLILLGFVFIVGATAMGWVRLIARPLNLDLQRSAVP